MDKLIKYKHPRIYHLSWSKGATSDDKILHDYSRFENEQIYISEKYDGENTTIYPYYGYSHARSVDSGSHWSRNHIRKLTAELQSQVLSNSSGSLWKNSRICGENVYATHSIKYDDLPSYFIVHSIWEGDRCYNIEITKAICEEYGLMMAESFKFVESSFQFDKKKLIDIANRLDDSKIEGYVIRLCDSFTRGDATSCVAKYVRANHVQTDEHWMNKAREVNGLRK